MFKEPTLNKIVPDISEASIYLRSTKKFGKTTLFHHVILAKYGDPLKGALISVGKEKGTKFLDNFNVGHIDTYKDFVECVDYLIAGKGTKHDIKMVAFDTGDELALLAEKEAIKVSNRENETKCKTINGAFGGFSKGPKYAAHELIKPLLGKLMDNGIGVWVIAHTKYKSMKDKGSIDEDGYMQLTSNLGADYESAFGDIFDITLTGTIDRTYDVKTITKNKKTITKKYVKESIRKLYFRSTLSIDAGGRFADGTVPDYMVIDNLNMDIARQLIDIIETGMELSKTENEGKRPYLSSSDEIDPLADSNASLKKTDDESIDDDIDEDIEDDIDEEDDFDEDENTGEALDDLMAEVRSLFKATSDKTTKRKVKDIIAEYGVLEDCDYEGLSEIRSLLTA